MPNISATDIAFEGLRLVREQPRAALVWAMILLGLGALSGVVMLTLAGDALAAMAELQRRGNATPEETLAAFGAAAPTYGLLLALSLLVYGVLFCAVFRAVLRPSEGGPGFVKVGGDEVRQVLVLLLYGLLMALVYLGAVMVASLVGGVLAVALSAAIGPPANVLVGLVAAVVVIGITGLVGARLSLATPMTFVDRRLRLLESWRLTKGYTWPLFGAYVLTFALMAVIVLLGMSIFAALTLVLGGGMGALGRLFSPDFSSLGAYYSPLTLAFMGVNALLGALTTALSAGAAAEAYRQLVPGGTVAAADAFD